MPCSPSSHKKLSQKLLESVHCVNTVESSCSFPGKCDWQLVDVWSSLERSEGCCHRLGDTSLCDWHGCYHEQVWLLVWISDGLKSSREHGQCQLNTMSNVSNSTEGQQVADWTCKAPSQIRNSETVDFFWKKVQVSQREYGEDGTSLPRMRKAPWRFEVGSGKAFYQCTAKELYS